MTTKQRREPVDSSQTELTIPLRQYMLPKCENYLLAKSPSTGTRPTFIAIGLSQGLNIKWLADYCGTSVAMIEKHYGRYINSDSEEQLKRLFEGQTGTFAETLAEESDAEETQLMNR